MQERVTPFQLFILVLSIYVIGAMVVDLVFVLSPQVQRLLEYMDYLVCLFFFIEAAAVSVRLRFFVSSSWYRPSSNLRTSCSAPCLFPRRVSRRI